MHLKRVSNSPVPAEYVFRNPVLTGSDRIIQKLECGTSLLISDNGQDCVALCSATTLLFGRQEWHLACKLHQQSATVLLWQTFGGTNLSWTNLRKNRPDKHK